MSQVRFAPAGLDPAPASSPVLLELNPIDFEEHFSRRPFLIGHRLCGHPLFETERILELARTLPERNIEYNSGDIPISMEAGHTPRNGLTPEETIRRIRDCRSWLVLKYVEQDRDYADLLNECLQELKVHTEGIAPGMTQPQAFLFVTSPESVTPYHIDPEHNFLLQIRGTKQIRMLDGTDRSIVSEEDLENFYADKGRNLSLRLEQMNSGWSYDLQPGQGLHFPVTFPHWVKNGDDVSISFSVTFRTPDLDRRRALYQINEHLRRHGHAPTPVGRNRLRDNLMYASFRLRRKLSSVFGTSATSTSK